MKIFLFLFLVSSASGIYIKCKFNDDVDWSVIGKVYTCKVTSTNFSDNSTHITGVGGTHLSGKSSADVGMIQFGLSYKCPENLHKIPKGFLKHFPNFIGLYFYECPISTLNGDELDEYPNLQYYSHKISNLISIPGNFFKSTPNMKFISFVFNKIQHVGANLLDHLKNLEQVWFYKNSCIMQNATKVPAFIEELRQKCPDIEPETTTQAPTTTMKTIPVEVSLISTSTTAQTTIMTPDEYFEFWRKFNRKSKTKQNFIESTPKPDGEINENPSEKKSGTNPM
jgi:hypothetical protein